MRKRTVPTVLATPMLFSTLVPALSYPAPQKPFVVIEDGKHGYINQDGKIVLKPQFLRGRDCEDGFAAVYPCGRTVWIDAPGNPVPGRWQPER